MSVHTAETATLPMIMLRIGARWFAIAASSVREVLTLESIISVPGLADNVLGLAHVRNRLVAVADLPAVLGVMRTGKTSTTRPRLLVLARGDDEAYILVDEAQGLLQLPAAVPSGASEFICGELEWNEQIVSVLDAGAIVAIVAPEAS